MAGMVPQMLIGPWLLWSLPDHVREPLVNGGNDASLTFFISLTLALLALVLLNATVVAPQYRWLAVGGVGCLAATFATMAIVRDYVRYYWLLSTGGRSILSENAQGGGVWIGIVVLFIGIGLAHLLVRRVRPQTKNGFGPLE